MRQSQRMPLAFHILVTLALLGATGVPPARAGGSLAGQGDKGTAATFNGPQPIPYDRIVPVGERRTIGFFSEVFPDCSSAGPVVLRLLRKPQHGTITFEEALSFPHLRPGTPAAACIGKRTPGTRLVYEAAADYEGMDTFEVLVIYSEGTATHLDGHVLIR